MTSKYRNSDELAEQAGVKILIDDKHSTDYEKSVSLSSPSSSLGSSKSSSLASLISYYNSSKMKVKSGEQRRDSKISLSSFSMSNGNLNEDQTTTPDDMDYVDEEDETYKTLTNDSALKLTNVTSNDGVTCETASKEQEFLANLTARLSSNLNEMVSNKASRLLVPSFLLRYSSSRRSSFASSSVSHTHIHTESLLRTNEHGEKINYPTGVFGAYLAYRFLFLVSNQTVYMLSSS